MGVEVHSASTTVYPKYNQVSDPVNVFTGCEVAGHFAIQSPMKIVST